MKKIVIAVVAMLSGIALAACGGGGGGGGATTSPEITVITSSGSDTVAFGSVTVGSGQDEVVTVRNDGTGSLDLGTIGAIDTPAAPFTITADTCSGKTLAAAGYCTIRFAPAAISNFVDSFDIPSNDGDESSKIISLTGTGTAIPVPNIVITDSVAPGNDLQILFGNVSLGTTRAADAGRIRI